MSKIFRRPMFRKGGNVGEGIMTGIRDNFSQGSARERLAKVAAEYPSGAIDPVSQFLIQGGMKLASQPKTGGGVFADISTALQDPTTQLFQGLAEKGQLEKKLALEGEILDIEGEREERIAKMKNQQKDFFASQTPEAQFEVLTDLYKESSIPVIKNNAFNLADFEVNLKTKKPNESYTQLSFEFGTDPRTKKKGYIPNWRGIPVNAVTYNPSTGLAYRRLTRENNDARDFIALDPNTLQPLGE
jgi:hypothetical protein